ncbi:GerMN domain-containing protein [Terriglobus roseus]|uniref:Sporulation and spore germination n=1 Tax=Terriglobus roseus TaxID=392734 RepID=A0A1H4RMJ6_9BACT|nr:GerMN domain-containing protein [Terriglobus roseus]SEC33038.1 Sporulation and spore germination [Terriglobus roseus]
MISRYQRILFAILLGSSVLMAAFLIYMHKRNFADVKNADNTPIEAPVYSASEDVTLDLANDEDGTITPTTRSLALPQQPAVRARALLEHLLADYTLPRAKHPVGGGIAVDDVFLVSLPLGASVLNSGTLLTKDEDSDSLTHASGELALVNLRSSWVEAHPPGITSETLTIQSIVGTLHTNLPEITKVRFLVDGHPRATLAGNVELDRTYDADSTMTAPVGKPSE